MVSASNDPWPRVAASSRCAADGHITIMTYTGGAGDALLERKRGSRDTRLVHVCLSGVPRLRRLTLYGATTGPRAVLANVLGAIVDIGDSEQSMGLHVGSDRA